MNKTSVTQQSKIENFALPARGILQRKCACCNQTVASGECAECGKKKNILHRKLAIGASNDPLEREADRVVDQVMAMPLNSSVNATPPRIQRFRGQTGDSLATAPASVDRVLASSGSALESAVRQDMESRFGYDFSQVRIHTNNTAAVSAQSVNARAFTVGQNVVFSAGQYSPETRSGRQLLAHELTHTLQRLNDNSARESGSSVVRRKPRSREERKSDRRRKRLLRFLGRVIRRGTKMATTRRRAAAQRAEKARQVQTLISSNDQEFLKDIKEAGFTIDPNVTKTLVMLIHLGKEPLPNGPGEAMGVEEDKIKDNADDPEGIVTPQGVATETETTSENEVVDERGKEGQVEEISKESVKKAGNPIELVSEWERKEDKTYKVNAKSLEDARRKLGGGTDWGRFQPIAGKIIVDDTASVNKVTLKVGYTITVPEWTGYKNEPKQECKDEWDRMMKSIFKHELKHILIYENSIKKLEEFILQHEKGGVTEKQIGDHWIEIAKTMEDDEKEYDDKTHHGYLEGVKLDPPGDCNPYLNR